MPSDLLVRLLPTPLVSSFVGRARPGDLRSHDFQERSAAWAQWILESFAEHQGRGDRTYVAVDLPGEFYDPKGTQPGKPHLEVSAHLLGSGDAAFPDRFAQAGLQLLTSTWMVPEATAARRVVLNARRGDLRPLLDVLAPAHERLLEGVGLAQDALRSDWGQFVEALSADPASVQGIVCGDFDDAAVSSYFPDLAGLGMSVAFDERLLAQNRGWAARRVGAWTVHAGPAALGVLTPRLAQGGILNDPLTLPVGESSAALLVRGLVLQRIGAHLGVSVPLPAPRSGTLPGSGIRAVPARPGGRLPAASLDAARAFVEQHPDVRSAWLALQRWSASGYALAVDEDTFSGAHARVVAAGEGPIERSDVDSLLPVALDEHSRVVRATFFRPVRP